MQDFPIFPTQYGVASLILREIPYRREAYIRVRDVQPGKLGAMLEECIAFCHEAGAERIYAAGHPELEAYPLHAIIYRMEGKAAAAPDMEETLRPVRRGNVAAWRKIYNEKMANVDNASTLTARDEPDLLGGGAYYVYRGDTLLGIGWLWGQTLMAIAALEPGAGESILRRLMAVIEGHTMTLEVSSTNLRAIRLYKALGLGITSEKARWYQVYPVPWNEKSGVSRKNT